MKQTKQSISNMQKDIRQFAGDHDVMTNIKVKKTTVKGNLKKNILPAGTPMSDKGVDKVTTYGLLFNDLDFTGIQDEETVTASVMVHGFVNEARIKEYTGEEVDEGVKTALKGKIQFFDKTE